MSIAIEIELYPYGSRLHAKTIARITIWTEGDNKKHGYALSWSGGCISGYIKKTKSAHQNVFHVLAKVLEHARPKLKKLGVDYIPRYTMEKC